MGRLTDIGKGYGTDKAEHHGFTQFYEEYFKKFTNPNILEVGIMDGSSLRTYDDYFNHKANIVGIDVNNKSHLAQPTITILQGDIMLDKSVEMCKMALPEGEMYDIIIDDGGHYMEQQQVTLYNLWSLLKPGGIFIIEDLHTSGMQEYNPHNTGTTLDILGGMKEKDYRRSIYLTNHQQKELNAEIADIRIWSKERTNTHGQPQQPSITSVIIKAGVNESMQEMKDLPEEEELDDVAHIEEHEVEEIIHPKKEITIYEPDEEEKIESAKALNIAMDLGYPISEPPEVISNKNKILKELDKAEGDLLQLSKRIQKIKESLR